MFSKSEIYKRDLENAFCGTVNIRELYNKCVLITGATGLIGSFITDLLLYADKADNAAIEVFALVRDRVRMQERFVSHLNNERFHCIIQDVTEPLKLEERVDYIIHAAGDGFPAAFREHPVETMTPALFGTYQLLQYAQRCDVKKFLYISSGEVYGKLVRTMHAFRENESGSLDSMAVRSCYPMAKRCAETLCVSFGEQYLVPIVVARLSHIYGACTSIHDNRATAQFLNDAIVGKDIVLHSMGTQMRSYTYVADCVSGILTLLINGKNGEAYNVASPGSGITITEFASILSEISGVDCVIKLPNEMEIKEHTPIEYAVLDPTKLQQLGWKAQYDVKRGIDNMFNIRKCVYPFGRSKALEENEHG